MTTPLEQAIINIFEENYDFDSSIFFDSQEDFLEVLNNHLLTNKRIPFYELSYENKPLLDFLEKFYYSISELPKPNQDYQLTRLGINTDISVMSGDHFLPKILLNGGLVFRNNHRVIGLSSSPVLFKEINQDFILNDFVNLLEENYKSKEDEDKEIHLSYINRTIEGIEWTLTPSKTFSKTGQSFILISNEVLNDDSSLSKELKYFADNSRTGQVIARVYEHGVYFFTTQRLSDNYDTMTEFFSSYLDIGDNEVVIKQDHNELKKTIENYSLDIANDVEGLDFLNDYTFINKYLKSHIIQNLTNKILSEFLDFNAMFSEDVNKPSGFEQSKLAYYQYIKEDSNLTVFQNEFKSIDVKDFIESFQDRVLNLVNNFNPEKTFVYFPPSDDQYNVTDLLDIYEFKSEELNEKLLEVFDFLESEYEADSENYDSFQEFIDDSEFLFSILMYTKEMILPEETHQFALDIGEDLEIPFSFFIPSIGYVQYYWGSEIDEGNCYLFFNTED